MHVSGALSTNSYRETRFRGFRPDFDPSGGVPGVDFGTFLPPPRSRDLANNLDGFGGLGGYPPGQVLGSD